MNMWERYTGKFGEHSCNDSKIVLHLRANRLKLNRNRGRLGEKKEKNWVTHLRAKKSPARSRDCL